ncbi:MAG: hypothetical protein ACRERC_23075 [Candidatus Binatia bacterium]
MTVKTVIKHKVKTEQAVWVPCVLRAGMMSSECYFSFTVPDDREVTGFVSSTDTQSGHVRATMLDSPSGTVLLVFSGELISATNPVEVPAKWAGKLQHAA